MIKRSILTALIVFLFRPTLLLAQVQEGAYDGTMNCDAETGNWGALAFSVPLKLTFDQGRVVWSRIGRDYLEQGQSPLAADGSFVIDASGGYNGVSVRSGQWRTQGMVTLKSTQYSGAVLISSRVGRKFERNCRVVVPVHLVETAKEMAPTTAPLAAQPVAPQLVAPQLAATKLAAQPAPQPVAIQPAARPIAAQPGRAPGLITFKQGTNNIKITGTVAQELTPLYLDLLSGQTVSVHLADSRGRGKASLFYPETVIEDGKVVGRAVRSELSKGEKFYGLAPESGRFVVLLSYQREDFGDDIDLRIAVTNEIAQREAVRKAADSKAQQRTAAIRSGAAPITSLQDVAEKYDVGNGLILVVYPPLTAKEGLVQAQGQLVNADGDVWRLAMGEKYFYVTVRRDAQYLNGSKERVRIGGLVSFVGNYIGQVDGKAQFVAKYIQSY